MTMNLISPLSVAAVLLCASLGVGAQSGAPSGAAQGPAFVFPPAGSGTLSGNSPGGATAPLAVSARDRVFMTRAASSGLYEVEASRLAEQKAGDQGVKEMASMLVKDRGAANAELMQLAASKGVSLPAKPPADRQAAVRKLSGLSGAAFDREYLRIVGISDHQKGVRLFENGSRSVKDPQLKAWIDKTLPGLRQHMSQARGMRISGSAADSAIKAKP